MNRPVFAYSGANPGVMAWVDAADDAGLVVDFTAQRRPCYSRTGSRPGPHNLLVDVSCAAATASTAGAARPLWSIDAGWSPPLGAAADTTFDVGMDGVAIRWQWHKESGTYVRSQDGQPHLAESGARISAANVVELVSVHVPSPVDARSPHPITVGTGHAVVHRDGRAVPVVWSRASAYDPFEFFHVPSGVPVSLDTGHTFIELMRG
jgi:hypothetical protein